MANNSSSGGLGIIGVLFIVFLVLKLVHMIDWSWWWVTAPLWGWFLLYVTFVVIGFIMARKKSDRNKKDS